MSSTTTINADAASTITTVIGKAGETVVTLTGSATIITEARSATSVTITTADGTGPTTITIGGATKTAANANAVQAGRSPRWLQGYANGQSGNYDKQLAEREECWDDYLDGYNTGKKSKHS